MVPGLVDEANLGNANPFIDPKWPCRTDCVPPRFEVTAIPNSTTLGVAHPMVARAGVPGQRRTTGA